MKKRRFYPEDTDPRFAQELARRREEAAEAAAKAQAGALPTIVGLTDSGGQGGFVGSESLAKPDRRCSFFLLIVLFSTSWAKNT
jgi:hypothetical protein